jgi:hypothetical protein
VLGTLAAQSPHAPTPRVTGLSTRVFVPLLLPFLILIGIGVYAAVTPYDSTNLPPPGQRGSLVWGDAIFANKFQMRAWLREHGGGPFNSWAKTHPAALTLLTPRPHRHVRAVPAKAKAKPAKTPIARKQASATAQAPVTSNTPGPVKWLFTAFGLLLVLAAVATPGRYVARLVVGPVRSDRDMRLAVAGAAIAVLSGVAVATLIG